MLYCGKSPIVCFLIARGNSIWLALNFLIERVGYQSEVPSALQIIQEYYYKNEYGEKHSKTRETTIPQQQQVISK